MHYGLFFTTPSQLGRRLSMIDPLGFRAAASHYLQRLAPGFTGRVRGRTWFPVLCWAAMIVEDDEVQRRAVDADDPRWPKILHPRICCTSARSADRVVALSLADACFTPLGALFAVLEVPAATEDDPEPTLEITRPLRDLGYDGALPPHEAISALADGATRLHARICIGPDPAGSRRLSLLLQGTLYLADLQREELDALVGELGGATREQG